MKLIKSIISRFNKFISGKVQRRVSFFTPKLDYKPAYRDVREFIDDPRVQEAIYFAHKNPEIVYGKQSKSCKDVVDGYFTHIFL